MTHAITWHTAQPLWDLSLADGGSSPARFRQPALLRFAGDDYMQQLERGLQQQPPSLSNYVARPESWEDERAGWRTEADGPDTDDLRLYQPAHYRYYCLAAALVCQQPGLPERIINVSRRERGAFVMRRLFPRSGVSFDVNDSSSYDEFAWVGTAQQGSWRPVPNPQLLLEDEERLALTPKTFSFESGKRTLQVGLIPVARRDIYQAGVTDVTAPVPAALLQADSFSSEAAATAWQKIDKSFELLLGANDPNSIDSAYTDGKKITFAHALVSVADFLVAELPGVSQALPSGTGSNLTAAQSSLLGRLNQVLSTGRSLRQMLVSVSDSGTRAALEDGSITPAAVDTVLGASLSASQLGSLANSIRGTNSELRDALVAAVDARVGGFARTVTSTWSDLAKPGLADQDAQDA